MKGRRTPISARERGLLGTIDDLEVRLREVHHRVRRQLQTIASLLHMQAERSRDERVARALADAGRRILTIATIDDQLQNQPTATLVDMPGAIRAISELAQAMQAASVPPVVVTHSLEPFALPSDVAVQCGLVVNELVTNALQHGFHGRTGGTIEVRAGVAEGRVTIVVRDDGIGPPTDGDASATSGLGLDLVRLLVTRQLHGEFTVDQAVGTRCTVTFPVPVAEPPGDTE